MADEAIALSDFRKLRLRHLLFRGIAPALGLGLIVVALSLTGSWKAAGIVVCLGLFILFSLRDSAGLVLLASLWAVSILEGTLGIGLGSVRGLSFINLALGASFFFAWIENLKNEKRFFLPCPLYLPLFLLTVYEFASLIVTHLQGRYPTELSDLLVLFKDQKDPFLFFLLAYNLPRSVRHIRVLLRILLGSYLAVIALSILNYYGLVRVFSFVRVDIMVKDILSGPYEPGLRLSGLFKDPNLFASFLVLFLPLSVAALFEAKKALIRAVLGIFLFFQVLTLILSGSRGGYVGLAAAAAAFTIFGLKRKLLSKRQVAAGAVLLLAVLLVLAAAYHEAFVLNVVDRFRFQGGLDLDVITNGRYSLWKTGLGQFIDSPLFGRGWMTLPDFHSDYIQSLATLGLAGFFLFIYILARIFRSARDLLRDARDKAEAWTLLGILAGLAGILTIMLGLNIHYLNHYLFFLGGIVLRWEKLAGRTAAEEALSPPPFPLDRPKRR